MLSITTDGDSLTGSFSVSTADVINQPLFLCLQTVPVDYQSVIQASIGSADYINSLMDAQGRSGIGKALPSTCHHSCCHGSQKFDCNCHPSHYTFDGAPPNSCAAPIVPVEAPLETQPALTGHTPSSYAPPHSCCSCAKHIVIGNLELTATAEQIAAAERVSLTEAAAAAAAAAAEAAEKLKEKEKAVERKLAAADKAKQKNEAISKGVLARIFGSLVEDDEETPVPEVPPNSGGKNQGLLRQLWGLISQKGDGMSEFADADDAMVTSTAVAAESKSVDKACDEQRSVDAAVHDEDELERLLPTASRDLVCADFGHLPLTVDSTKTVEPLVSEDPYPSAHDNGASAEVEPSAVSMSKADDDDQSANGAGSLENSCENWSADACISTISQSAGSCDDDDE